MKTLADEILAWLPGFVSEDPRGATIADICAALVVGQPYARAAIQSLDADGRATFLRYPGSKTHYLVPLGHDLGPGIGCCPNCRVVFRFNPNKSPCCSKACGSQHWWATATPEQREARTRHLAERQQSPEGRARQSAISKARAADPAFKAAQSERSKKFWADPAKAAVHAAKIQKIANDPEKRRAMSKRRKKDWQDPAYREKLVGAHRLVAATPEYRARRSATLKAVWAHPVTGEKMRAATRQNIARAVDAIRGTKQTPEQIRKRVEAARRTRELNRRSRPTVQDRLAPVLAYGPLGVRELEAALPGTYRQAIYAALHEMKAAGQVKAIRDGRNVRYALICGDASNLSQPSRESAHA